MDHDEDTMSDYFENQTMREKRTQRPTFSGWNQSKTGIQTMIVAFISGLRNHRLICLPVPISIRIWLKRYPFLFFKHFFISLSENEYFIFFMKNWATIYCRNVGSASLICDFKELWKQFLVSISSNVRDYLSMEHVGLILKYLARKGI